MESGRNFLDLSDDALLKAHIDASNGAHSDALNTTVPGRAMLAADPDRRAALVARAIALWADGWPKNVGRAASELLRTDSGNWTVDRLVKAVEAASTLRREDPAFSHFSYFPHKPLISAVEKAAKRELLSPALHMALERWRAAISPRALTADEERRLGEAETVALDEATPWPKASRAFETMELLKRIRTPLTEERKLIERLTRLISRIPGEPQGEETEGVVQIDSSDAVGAAIVADCRQRGRAAGSAWAALLNHARSLNALVPSKKWSDTAARLVAAVPAEAFGACIADWFNCAGRATPGLRAGDAYAPDPATLLNDSSVSLLKGLAWSVAAARRIDLMPALGTLADACYQKVRNKGPRNVKVANAATAALAAFGRPEAAAQLSWLRLRVKHRSAHAAVDKALAGLSRKTGLSPEDLEELSVPDFGLDAAGIRRETVGSFTAELRVAGAHDVELRWLTAAGEPGASVPPAIRTHHAGELKRLKREEKDASGMLAAQALRLEQSFVSERSWPCKTWRERYLCHPLVGTLARRLIWRFDGAAAIFCKGALTAANGREVAPGHDATVSLWHPIHSTPEEVLAWRQWLEEHEVIQPFKQAHREIYLLTDAERRTRTYSNRFAAHILRQHQLAALCRQRGWDYNLQGRFDSHNVPALTLPGLGLRVEFWVEPVENEASSHGIFLHVATDQVRFGQPLDQVPPVAFSEVMRDIDLFVGVSSVGNDPTWNDGGPEGRYLEYWQNYSFGDLTPSARTRKAALESLVPRLKIAAQCSFEERFLVVRGSLRTYKIHLGSGNILMAPNDQYLCIVPKPGAPATGSRWLPFEGDRTLSVILSKAFLLAEDSKIKDPGIVSQIRK